MNKNEKAEMAVKVLETTCIMANQIETLLKAANQIDDQELRNKVKGDIAIGIVDVLDSLEDYFNVDRMIRQYKKENMEDLF